MPIPELERRRVERALERFAQRVPVELRPRTTEHPFARFVYGPAVGGWSLRWADRNGRWRAYEGFQDRPHFGDLLRRVEIDPIFLG